LAFLVFRAYRGDVDHDLLTTTEAARLLGCSRQHVVDLCNSGRLPYTQPGTHRRIRRADVEAWTSPPPRREDERSRWLHQAVAGKLVANPDRVMAIARKNLDHQRRVHSSGRSDMWLNRWQQILDHGVGKVLDVLTSRAPSAVDLRQTSPFAGVLTDDERQAVLTAFYATWDTNDLVTV
jgi:excisionase family DNA binding protein